MKILRRLFVFILILVLLPVNANAQEHDSQIVYKTTASGTEGSGNWQYHPPAGESLYYVDDASGIPNGGGYYFFKYGDGKFCAFPQGDLIALILNRGLGVTYNPNKFLAFVQAYLAQLPTQKGHLFTTGDIDLGICLNDISGCKYEGAPDNQNVDIPSTETNNVYNFYTYYIDHDGKEYPAYINMPCRSSAQAKTDFDWENANFGSAAQSAVESSIDMTQLGSASMSGEYWRSPLNIYNNVATITTDSTSSFNSLCDKYGLTAERHVVTWNEYVITNTGAVLFKLYDSSDTLLSPLGVTHTFRNNEPYKTISNVSGQATYLWYKGGSYPNYVFTTNGGYKTVYPSLTQPGLIARNIYAPQSYQSTQYTEYNNQSENNNIQTTTNQISNGGSSNETVYNNTKTTNNQYITNNSSNVDNSQIITNTTTTINNYYYGSSGDDNPDNPDDPSGDGGLEDDSLLDTLLAAILKLLRAIGKIIATILTGIIEIITDVLEAIANITTAFTGIIDFIASIFGFLPSECIAVLTLGLTLSVLIALLKMFGK